MPQTTKPPKTLQDFDLRKYCKHQLFSSEQEKNELTPRQADLVFLYLWYEIDMLHCNCTQKLKRKTWRDYDDGYKGRNISTLDKLIDIAFFKRPKQTKSWKELAITLSLAAANGVPYSMPVLRAKGYSDNQRYFFAAGVFLSTLVVFYFAIDLLWKMITNERFFQQTAFFSYNTDPKKLKRDRSIIAASALISALPITALSYYYRPQGQPLLATAVLLLLEFSACFISRIVPMHLMFHDHQFHYFPFGIFTQFSSLKSLQNQRIDECEDIVRSWKHEFTNKFCRHISSRFNHHCRWNKENWTYEVFFDNTQQTNGSNEHFSTIKNVYTAQNHEEWLDAYNQLQPIQHHRSPLPDTWRNISNKSGMMCMPIAALGFSTITYFGFLELFANNFWAALIITVISNYPLLMFDALIGRETFHFHTENAHIAKQETLSALPFYYRLYTKSSVAYLIMALMFSSFHWMGAVSVIEETLGENTSLLYNIWTKGFAMPCLVLDSLFVFANFFKCVTHKLNSHSNSNQAILFNLNDDLAFFAACIDHMDSEQFIDMLEHLQNMKHSLSLIKDPGTKSEVLPLVKCNAIINMDNDSYPNSYDIWLSAWKDAQHKIDIEGKINIYTGELSAAAKQTFYQNNGWIPKDNTGLTPK